VRNISAVKKMNVPKLEIVGTTPDDWMRTTRSFASAGGDE
jgi:hypothetical protein